MALYVKYQADIWVEVDAHEDDVVHVVVDELSMATAIEVVDDLGGKVSAYDRTEAVRIAESRDWPSWDYGPRPT